MRRNRTICERICTQISKQTDRNEPSKNEKKIAKNYPIFGHEMSINYIKAQWLQLTGGHIQSETVLFHLFIIRETGWNENKKTVLVFSLYEMVTFNIENKDRKYVR